MLRRKKILAKILLTALLCTFFTSSCASSVALIIPAKQKTVPASAYRGDTTLQAVVLQEGITSIGSKAFADSSLTDISLPSTLVSIADDAFDGAPLTTVHAEKGSPAYEWLREKGYFAEYRALLIGEQRFLWFSDEEDPDSGYGLDEADKRNIGDLSNMKAALDNVIGPAGPYGSAGGAFQITQKQNLDYDGIRSAIQSTFADTTEQDLSIFFIATHGHEKGDGELRTAFTGDFLDTSDVAEYWQQRYLSFDTLASWLKTYVKGRVFVILESCGSGSAIFSTEAEENRLYRRDDPVLSQPDESEAAERFVEKAVEVFAEADPGMPASSVDEASRFSKRSTGDLRLPKFYVLAASRHREKSYGWETGEAASSYNYFTKWLTEGIGRQGSSPADTNKNDYLTLKEMFTHVKQYDHIVDQGITYYQHVQRYPADSEDNLLKLREPFSYKVTGTQGNPHILGSGKDAVFTVRRSVQDGETFGRFESVFVDQLALEPGLYGMEKGSLILTLKNAYLETLSEGTYKMLIRFSDGETETGLTVKKAERPVPGTGDSSRPVLWLALLLLGLSGLGITLRRGIKKQDQGIRS